MSKSNPRVENEKGRRLLHVFFFLFPFFLYLGIALQAGGFYVIALLLPSLVFFSHQKALPSFFWKVGVCFILLHIVFPLTSLVRYVFPNAEVDPNLYHIIWTWPGILQSNFPSSLFIAGVLLLIFWKLTQKPVSSSSDVATWNVEPLKFFLLGLSVSSLVFLAFTLYQHVGGLDLRSLFRRKHEYLGPGDMFANGRFRVYGFYGHPLTAAGVSLAYSTFSWALLWYWVTRDRNVAFIPYHSHRFKPILILGSIALANGVVLGLTGGRTAALMGVAQFILIPIYFNVRRNFLATLATVLALSGAAFLMAQKTGLFARMERTVTAVQKSDTLEKENYRTYFWKTYYAMFKDNPVLGQGNYWLKQGVRDAYYQKKGFGHIPEKFPAHNVYLETLGSGGVFSLVWVFGVAFFLFRYLRREVFARNALLSSAFWFFCAAVVVNMGHGITQNVFFDSSVIYIYISLLLMLLWQQAFSAPRATPLRLVK